MGLLRILWAPINHTAHSQTQATLIELMLLMVSCPNSAHNSVFIEHLYNKLNGIVHSAIDVYNAPFTEGSVVNDRSDVHLVPSGVITNSVLLIAKLFKFETRDITDFSSVLISVIQLHEVRSPLSSLLGTRMYSLCWLPLGAGVVYDICSLCKNTAITTFILNICFLKYYKQIIYIYLTKHYFEF